MDIYICTLNMYLSNFLVIQPYTCPAHDYCTLTRANYPATFVKNNQLLTHINLHQLLIYSRVSQGDTIGYRSLYAGEFEPPSAFMHSY